MVKGSSVKPLIYRERCIMSEKVTFLDALANSEFTKRCGTRSYFVESCLESRQDNEEENEHRMVRARNGEVVTSRRVSVPASIVDRAVKLAGIETRVRLATGERVDAKATLTPVKPGVVKRAKKA
jgi:hypothetical protein